MLITCTEHVTFLSVNNTVIICLIGYSRKEVYIHCSVINPLGHFSGFISISIT